MKYNGRYGEAPPERDTSPAQVSDISKDREFTNRIQVFIIQVFKGDLFLKEINGFMLNVTD